MAAEFECADSHGLYLLARLREDFERTPVVKPRQRAVIAGEIRLGEARFGLTPINCPRLQWQVEAAESAMDKGRQRRARTIHVVDPDDDPRNLLGKL